MSKPSRLCLFLTLLGLFGRAAGASAGGRDVKPPARPYVPIASNGDPAEILKDHLARLRSLQQFLDGVLKDSGKLPFDPKTIADLKLDDPKLLEELKRLFDRDENLQRLARDLKLNPKHVQALKNALKPERMPIPEPGRVSPRTQPAEGLWTKKPMPPPPRLDQSPRP